MIFHIDPLFLVPLKVEVPPSFLSSAVHFPILDHFPKVHLSGLVTLDKLTPPLRRYFISLKLFRNYKLNQTIIDGILAKETFAQIKFNASRPGSFDV